MSITGADKELSLRVIIKMSNSFCTKCSIFDLFMWDCLYDFFLIGVDPGINSMMWSLEHGGGIPWGGFWNMLLCSSRSSSNLRRSVFYLSSVILSMEKQCKKKAWAPFFYHLFHFIGWDNLGRGAVNTAKLIFPPIFIEPYKLFL